jgi:hypothetical protein
MQTKPPSVGNNVKLKPLSNDANFNPYNYGFINLTETEPSLGVPTGLDFTVPGELYYFPVFGISNSYLESRKYTGNNSLVYRNGNVGYNNTNPVYNIDINGTFRSLSAYIPTLSTDYIVAAYPNTVLEVKCNAIFDTFTVFNSGVKFNSLTANNILTQYISAAQIHYFNTVTTTFTLSTLSINGDLNIYGTLTANNVFVNTSLSANSLSSTYLNTGSLQTNNANVNNSITTQNVYSTNLHGKIDIDPASLSLYYNNLNQLGFSSNREYKFAVRPSDSHSTDDITLARTYAGPWDSTNAIEDSDVLRPYFKNLKNVFDYVAGKGLAGSNLKIYIDNDIVCGEKSAGDGGTYNGLTVTGNLTSAYYSKEWLNANYPALVSAGILGGEFVWANNPDIAVNGKISHITVPALKFNNVSVIGRYQIGTTIYSGKTYYSEYRKFNQAPRKISCRTYVCTTTALSFKQFDTNPARWNYVNTNNLVQFRPIEFNGSTTTTTKIKNICFEFNSNTYDSTALDFYNGNNILSNTTVALLGPAIYSYGALNLNSQPTKITINGDYLLDPYFVTSTWSTSAWTIAGLQDPNVYPGYGLAIIGNPSTKNPTIINSYNGSYDVGFINVKGGSTFNMEDPDYLNRNFGQKSSLKASIILDGTFNANNLFYVDNKNTIFNNEQIFSTVNFKLSSKDLNFNNTSITPSYVLSFNPITTKDFKFITFNGSFNVLNSTGVGFYNWFFTSNTGSPGPYVSYISQNNGEGNVYYNFKTSTVVDLVSSLNTVGKLNALVPENNISSITNNSISYLDLKTSSLKSTNTVYYIKNIYNSLYNLSFYSASTR